MRTNVARSTEQAEHKLVDRQLSLGPMALQHGQSSVKSSDGALWILKLVAQAIDATMQRNTAALTMGLDQGQMTRQLQGEGHLSVRKLGELPETFWRQLTKELENYYGMLDRAQLIEQGEALIDRGRQLLAKAAQR